MQVFKFGGASVKDANSVRNVAHILANSPKPLVVVISAMGKTTNAIEAILDAAFRHIHQEKLEELRRYHAQIVQELFGEEAKAVLVVLDSLFAELSQRLKKLDGKPYGQVYDSVVGYGELLATKIVAAYLHFKGLNAHWIDARTVISTDDQWQEGQIDWPTTESQAKRLILPLLKDGGIALTQGFIGATPQGDSTTLGREGSDFTAAILASCLQAENVTIWKDVPGVLNADPKRVKDTVLFDFLPYEEAAEMTYYGASVIHPKTIKPLANKGIPLYVRSFLDPEKPGTSIGAYPPAVLPPAIIFKPNQTVVRFEAKDLSNINQRTLADLIDTLSDLHVNINLMMNTAVSFSVCINTQQHKLDAVLSALQTQFHIAVQHNLELVTLKNYTEQTIAEFYRTETALLSLRTHKSFQFVRES